MAFSAALRSNLPTFSSQFWSLRLNGKQKGLALKTSLLRRGHSLWIVKSDLDNGKSGLNENGAIEPARVLLEWLFAQTQKLEEQMDRDSRHPNDILLGLNLESLESDLLAALTSLKRKEEDLHNAERMVLSEHTELNHAKEELERRETQIAALCSKQEKIEEDLKYANLNLASQARQIEDLKLQLRERDQEIAAVQSTLSLKEDELNKTRNELVKKSEEAAKVDSELKLKARFLNEASEVVKKQEIELQELRKAIIEKEEELEVSVARQKVEKEILEVAEANLEKRTMEYLIVQDELKRLAEEASKNMKETNGTLEDFRSVRKLLTDVRFELVSSRQKMQDQEQLLEKQLEEFEERRKSVMSYMTSLKDAHIEVESERVKLRVAEARNKDLERDLSMEKEMTEELHKELKKEKSSLQQAIQDMSSLQEELDRSSTKFAETCNLLQVKKSELVEAKLEIQHLKSEQASLQHILEEKDWELLNARKNLKEVNEEVTELKMLMISREDQLVQATSMLKKKEEHVQMMDHELNTTKLKFSEAETVVERIAELTNKLVISIKNEDYDVSSTFHNMGHDSMQSFLEKPADEFKWHRKQLENELELIRGSLRRKETEVLAAQWAIAKKDEELETVLGRLDARDGEVRRLKEEMIQDTDDLKKLYVLAQESIGEKNIGDLAIEKLQLEAAQLEVEAATGALHKLVELSRELLNKASLSIEADSYTNIFPLDGFDPRTSVVHDNESLSEVKTEVARLSTLTEQLLHEAGLVNTDLR